MKKDDRERFACKPGTQASADNRYCGGYHARSIHLDFVGHAALTDRLLEVDPEWYWEPMGTDEYGQPVFDKLGGMWIKLTVLGVTRLGYGDAQGKTGPNAIKEVIGDALRNAGMRFGMALDLWHKGDLHEAQEEQGKIGEPSDPTPARTPSRRKPAAKAEEPAVNAPPSDWQSYLRALTTLEEIDTFYKQAVAENWWGPTVRPAFTARKSEIESAQADPEKLDEATANVAAAFKRPAETPAEAPAE